MTPTTRAKPTLKDVAQLAGCSTAVVSTVINNARGNTLASQAMQRRVWDAAKQLGYRPNFASRSLVRRSAETIGIYIPPEPWAGIGMRYEGAVVQGIEQACREHGYDVLAINLGGSGTPDTCAHKFAEQRIDGLILLHVDHEADWVAPLLKQAPNIAAVNYYGDVPVDRVNFDDRAAGAMAVRHLAQLGHRRIAFVSSWREALGPGAKLRCDGYREAMAGLGLAVDPRWVWDRSNEQLRPAAALDAVPRDPHAAADHLWSLGDAGASGASGGDARPTAVVTYNDQTAAHLMHRLQQLGAKVPDEVSIVGMDGTDICDLVMPELTSIRQPFVEMGRLATERVIGRTSKPVPADAATRPRRERPEGPQFRLMGPELIVRQSTGVAPAPGSVAPGGMAPGGMASGGGGGGGSVI